MAALTFDDLAPAAAAPAPSGALTFDDLVPAPSVNPAMDIAKAVPSKLAEGAVKLVGLPGDIARGAVAGADMLESWTSGRPYEDVRNERDARAVLPSTRLDRITGEGIKGAVERDGGFHFYHPQTTAGKILGGAAEFVPGALAFGGAGSAAEVLGGAAKYGAIPGAASEAVGQVADDTGYGPAARTATAVLTGGAAGYLSRPSKALSTAADELRGLPPPEAARVLERAQELKNSAAAQSDPVFLSNANAIDQASGGRTNLSEMQRQVEGIRGPLPEYAGNPQAIDNSARAQFDRIAPAAPPEEVGAQFQGAAANAMQQTPEAQGLQAAQVAAGPRVTPEQAGQVIQPALRGEYDARVAARAAQANVDYPAARNSPSSVQVGERTVETPVAPYAGTPDPTLAPGQADALRSQVVSAQVRAGTNPAEINPQQVDQAVQVLARGLETDPAAAYANAPQHASASVQQTAEPVFGQVDARPVAATVAEQTAVQRGGARDALAAADRALRGPGGQLGASVEELQNSRAAIGDLLSTATRNGENNTARVLQNTLDRLDQALEQVPEVATANANFARNSQQLRPFDNTPPIAGAIERDQYNTRFVQPPEQVPGSLQTGGASTSREFNAVAPAPAQAAYNQHLTTQFLDKATDAVGTVSADKLRLTLRENADLLAQHPEVATRLRDIAAAREGLDRIQGTTLGKLANADPDVKQAISVLFPLSPTPGSSEAGARALAAVARNNPWAARQLVRTHAETVFEQATQDLTGGVSQSGGAKFEVALRGNPNSERAKNLEALVRALPEGDTIANGFGRFLDVLEAGGRRLAVGSKTAYNAQWIQEWKKGGFSGAAKAIATSGLKLPAQMMQKIEDWKLGRNVDELARLLSDPDAISAFRGILKAGDVSGPTGRLIAIASRSSRDNQDKQN